MAEVLQPIDDAQLVEFAYYVFTCHACLDRERPPPPSAPYSR